LAHSILGQPIGAGATDNSKDQSWIGWECPNSTWYQSDTSETPNSLLPWLKLLVVSGALVKRGEERRTLAADR